MSRYDVDWGEMEDLVVVAPFLDEMHTHFAEGPAPQIGTELATLFVFGAPPVGVVNPPKPATPHRTARRVAAGAVGGLALVAGMGAAGALPAPIQEPVANAAKLVGLNLPHPHHHHHPTPGSASDSRGDEERSPSVTTHAHHSIHTPTDSNGEPTLAPDETSGTGSATTSDQSGSVTHKSGSGSSTSTGSSTVTGSGSAVSSTGGSTSGGTNGSNQHQRPTYHGNGRTTRDHSSSSTSTTTPPAGSGDSGGGSTPTTQPSNTTPTTTAPSS
jgi:hypothetical protein